jgi:uncharacterized iron-regulated protein
MEYWSNGVFGRQRMTNQFQILPWRFVPKDSVMPGQYANTPLAITRFFPMLHRSITPILFLTLLVSCASRGGIDSRHRASARFDDAFWSTLEQADIIYVGEIHTDQAHHEYQLALIQGLISRRQRFAIGWEMFDLTQQGDLDLWQRRKISTDELLKRTDFNRRWGNYSPLYRRILETSRRAHVPTIALNAPPSITRKIARGEDLAIQEKEQLPEGFVTDEGAYRNFASMMREHPGMQEADLRNFFRAQSVWDQTMATRLLDFHQKNPGKKLVVLCGRGHISGGYGIPYFVRQKSSAKQLLLFPRGDRDVAAGQKRV